MESKLIRKKFFEYFKAKSHQWVPSAPIVVKNDPTLMFTNAGMNQFKDYFLGNKKADQKRVVDTQKCLRVSGKHNDLEEVGFDTYHHTMFEMLGNWSFGDYFKKEAIAWSWDLLTKEFGLSEERLYVTVFEGDEKEQLETDIEARDFWRTHVPENRIINGNKKDNFWEMGEVGPCGPCSEIHIDLRDEKELILIPGASLVNKDHPKVVEIWNIVFVEFNRLISGALQNLPEKHVDTGMGFERLAMALQGKQSNYDTDVFQPLIQAVAHRAQVQYGANDATDVAIRVIADHIRAIAFTIADGQLPSNTKAGYVIRRILRRAVRYGYTFLKFNEPFLFELLPILSHQFSETFPEIEVQEEFLAKVIKEEEIAFLRTLEKGLARFSILKKKVKEQITGVDAFELYDTYGFPIDLTALISKENGLSVDLSGFEKEMGRQKSRSKNAAIQDMGDWNMIHEISVASEFVGYDLLTTDTQIIRWREIKQKDAVSYQLVLSTTPFYAESGGQIGDSGQLIGIEETIDIIDTKKENDLFIHKAKRLPKNLEGIFRAEVNQDKRSLIENNHTATHLLHAALREILGDHVQQRGSLVNDQSLRFDFSHFTKLSAEELLAVEQQVNQKIRKNISLVERRSVPIEKAKEEGATALFGEKYGDHVRMIIFDAPYSVELCGGTHVKATGHIGMFKITSESSISTGVRRIEAITADMAESFLWQKIGLLDQIEQTLKHPSDTLKALQVLFNEKNELINQIEAFNKAKTKELKKTMMEAVEVYKGVNIISFEGTFPDAASVKEIAFDLKREMGPLILLIGANVGGKPLLTLMIQEELAQQNDLNASILIRQMAKSIQGGGGGQDFYATAGGKNIEGLTAALEIGNQILKEKI